MNEPVSSIPPAAGSDQLPPAVSVEGLRIRYGKSDVVKGIDLSVSPGEIVSLLGPSGCGKTTTLRAIGGFVTPHAGTIRMQERDITMLAPHKRGIGLVFQGYALFPHLSVFDNVAYGLRMRGVPRNEIPDRVSRTLSIVKLDQLADRKPKQLSGGQQQRVAIARALIIEPAVLLMDEPLSNLDAKLRNEMRVELRRLLKQFDAATIFVTHDQEEAIVLSDRIILMNAGQIEQEGKPAEIYHRPQTVFAATFLGNANFLDGVVADVDASGMAAIAVNGKVFRGVAANGLEVGAMATLSLKHERLHIGPTRHGNKVTAVIKALDFLGPNLRYECSFDGAYLVGLLPGTSAEANPPTLGQSLDLSWDERDGIIFPTT